MTKKDASEAIVRRSLWSWLLLPANRRHQILLLAIVLVTVVVRVVPIEMQKRIVDEGILGRDARLLAIYCTVYLVAFLAASGLKAGINALQTIIGQRTLAVMRRQMFGHIVHLPYGFFRNTQSGSVVATLLTELATAGDFIGLAVAVPATNLLTLAAFGTYLFLLNPLLAAVSFSIYPVVVAVIPMLQKRVNHYNRKRVDATRQVSGKIGEVIDGLHEIKTCNAYRHEESRFGRLVDNLCRIRIVWNLYRYAVKVTNNLLTNFSRFLMFAVGGYLALKGQLAIGSLVAFLSAQEKLYDPWKEMIRYYQAYQTAIVTYRRAMKTYDAIPEQSAQVNEGEVPVLEGEVAVEQAGYRTGTGATLLRDITLTVEAGEHLALVGASGSGKSTLSHCIVGLMPPSEGRITIGGQDVTRLTRVDLSRNIAFVPQGPFVFRGTIAENLYYPENAERPAATVRSKDDSQQRLNDCIEVIQQVGLFVDVLGFGLDHALDEDASDALKEDIVAVRRRLAPSLGDEWADHVERFERGRFLHHASLAENLFLGRLFAQENSYLDELAAHPDFIERLTQSGLRVPFLRIGRSVLVELNTTLQRLPIPEDMQRLLPLDMEQIRIARNLAEREISDIEHAQLDAAEKKVLLKVALACIPGKVPGVELPEDIRHAVVAARERFQNLAERIASRWVSFYQSDRYIEKAPLLTNILFGRVITERNDVRRRIREKINRALIEKELLEAIVAIGLQHQVGTAGKNLSGGQRQKLAIARALLKRPPLLVFDEATASLDRASQSRIQEILVRNWKGRSTLIAVIHRLDILSHYDRVAVLHEGRLVEFGKPQELLDRKGHLYDLATDEAPSDSR